MIYQAIFNPWHNQQAIPFVLTTIKNGIGNFALKQALSFITQGMNAEKTWNTIRQKKISEHFLEFSVAVFFSQWGFGPYPFLCSTKATLQNTVVALVRTFWERRPHNPATFHAERRLSMLQNQTQTRAVQREITEIQEELMIRRLVPATPLDSQIAYQSSNETWQPFQAGISLIQTAFSAALLAASLLPHMQQKFTKESFSKLLQETGHDTCPQIEDTTTLHEVPYFTTLVNAYYIFEAAKLTLALGSVLYYEARANRTPSANEKKRYKELSTLKWNTVFPNEKTGSTFAPSGFWFACGALYHLNLIPAQISSIVKIAYIGKLAFEVLGATFANSEDSRHFGRAIDMVASFYSGTLAPSGLFWIHQKFTWLQEGFQITKLSFLYSIPCAISYFLKN